MCKYRVDKKYVLLIVLVTVASLSLPFVLSNTLYLRVTHEMEIVDISYYGEHLNLYETVMKDLSTGEYVSIVGPDVFYVATSGIGQRMSVSYTSVLFMGRCVEYRSPMCRPLWIDESTVLTGHRIFALK